MTKSHLLIATMALAFCLLGLLTLSLFTHPKSVRADATGVPATVATTSNPIVTTASNLIFATSTCSARTISTASSSLMITFTDAQGKVPTATFGTFQNSSTTVTYDAAQFGCGAVRVYSFNSGIITVQEAR